MLTKKQTKMILEMKHTLQDWIDGVGARPNVPYIIQECVWVYRQITEQEPPYHGRTISSEVASIYRKRGFKVKEHEIHSYYVISI